MTHSRALILPLILLSIVTQAEPEHSPWPGGIGIVRVPGDVRPSVTVDGQPALIIRADDEWLAVIGIPLEQSVPGTMTALIAVPDEPNRQIEFDVRANTYEEQRLKVDRK